MVTCAAVTLTLGKPPSCTVLLCFALQAEDIQASPCAGAPELPMMRRCCKLALGHPQVQCDCLTLSIAAQERDSSMQTHQR